MRLEIIAGGRVRLGNSRGVVSVRARLFDGLQQGVVIVESIWPNADFAEQVDIDALISAIRGRPSEARCSMTQRSGSSRPQ